MLASFRFVTKRCKSSQKILFSYINESLAKSYLLLLLFDASSRDTMEHSWQHNENVAQNLRIVGGLIDVCYLGRQKSGFRGL